MNDNKPAACAACAACAARATSTTNHSRQSVPTIKCKRINSTAALSSSAASTTATPLITAPSAASQKNSGEATRGVIQSAAAISRAAARALSNRAAVTGAPQ